MKINFKGWIVKKKKIIIRPEDFEEQKTKLKRTPSKGKEPKQPTLEKKIEKIRQATDPDLDYDSNEDEWMEGSGLIYYNNPDALIKKLEIICGSINAGNTSSKIRNHAILILDELLKLKRISKKIYEGIFNNYIR